MDSPRVSVSIGISAFIVECMDRSIMAIFRVLIALSRFMVSIIVIANHK